MLLRTVVVLVLLLVDQTSCASRQNATSPNTIPNGPLASALASSALPAATSKPRPLAAAPAAPLALPPLLPAQLPAAAGEVSALPAAVVVPSVSGAPAVNPIPVVVAGVPPTTTRRPFFQGTRAPCACDAGQCGCCTGVLLERFRQKACMNFTYEPDDFSITATMSMNERVLYKNTFSGKNPPPMCIRVPRFRFIELCVEVSNVYLASRNIHMCVDAEATWEDFTLVEWSFDCFRLGASGVAVVGPEDGGGLPGDPLDEEDQTDEDYDDSARDIPIPGNNNMANGKLNVKNDVKRKQSGLIEIKTVKQGFPIMAKEVDNGVVEFLFDSDITDRQHP